MSADLLPPLPSLATDSYAQLSCRTRPDGATLRALCMEMAVVGQWYQGELMRLGAASDPEKEVSRRRRRRDLSQRWR